MNKIFTVVLPDIGEGVVEGEIIEWLKEVGDSIKQDEPIVVVMTDKATVELPAPYPGILAKQYYKVGEVSIKDQPLYDIELNKDTSKKENDLTKIPKESKRVSSNKEENHIEEISQAPKSIKTQEKKRTLATPAMRKMAKDLGVDINAITGTGTLGRITPNDIRNFLTKHTSPPSQKETPITYFEGDETKPLQGIRSLISQKMTESKSTIPHFSFFDTANADYLVQLKNNLKKDALKRGIHLTFLPLFIKSLSLCLKEHPQFNASIDKRKNVLVFHRPHNVGIAMKTSRGLIVPVLKNVQDLNLEGIAKACESLKEKALNHQLLPEDMKGSTITLSNFGTEGGLWATPVINYPEVAILALAKIQKQAIVKGDKVVVCNTLNCSWSFDHRLIDGNVAAEFSNSFISLIENPSRLL